MLRTVAVTFLALACTTAHADVSPYAVAPIDLTIEGTVAQGDGTPVPGASVELSNEAGLVVGSAVAAADGRYAIEVEAPPGPYRLTVRVGEEIFVEEDVDVLPGADSARRTVELWADDRDAPRPPPPPPPGPPVHVHGPGPQGYTLVQVFYATDRGPGRGDTPAEAFGSQRDARGRLHLGTCDVSIPKDHRLAALEAPSITSFEFEEDPTRHVVLMRVTPRGPDNFYRDLRARLARSSRREALVFVHGYNVSFADAARRTAQLAYDLQLDGAPILYSWPAEERFWRYTVAEANIEWTTAHLRDFLTRVAAESGASAVHVVAHSMGNRATVHALHQIAARLPSSGTPLFHQIALTAPDVDADVFVQLASEIRRTARQVTLYVSSTDEALKSSARLHAYPRAGLAGGRTVVVPGIDTVEVSAVDTSLLKHSYFGDNASVVSDLHVLLRDGKPPRERFGLRPAGAAPRQYWRFVPRTP